MRVTEPTWVFGYGSLIFKQDFPYIASRRGTIDGWARRFWQGSHDHRGTETRPGRVVTLVAAPGERCTGRAFLVAPETFEHLDHREKNGYERLVVDIRFPDGTLEGVVYRATEENHAFLGPATIDEIAAHVAASRGPSGENSDYVLALAAALRQMRVEDPHVFEIEQALKHLAQSS